MRSSAPVKSELRAGVAFGAFALGLSWGPAALAEGPAGQGVEVSARSVHALAALSIGRGLRFNNPYRLASPLGETAESVSLSATYLDVGAGVLFPAAPALEHGASLDVLLALDGIAQLGLTASYLLHHALSRHVGLHGRVGIPLVVAPDASVGLEAAVGPHVPIAYGLGVTAEVVASVFFGAATEQKSVTTVPMLALQLGVSFDERVAF